MPSALDQAVAKCETILAQCLIAANEAAAAAASIGDEGLAPLASPQFSGVPTTPTPAGNDSSNQIINSAWVAEKLGVASGLATLGIDGLIPIAQLPFTTLTFDGVWNAATNSPTLSSSSGTAGHYRIVQVSGSTTLNGISTWNVGDQAIFNGSIWQRIPFVAPPVSNLPLSSLETIATATVVGNTSGGSSTPSAITISSITSFLSTMVGDSGAGGVKGLVPAPPPGSTGSGSFLRADGVWGSVGAPNLSLYATLANPAFTGTATVSTQARGNFGSAIASTAFVINQQAQATELALIQVNGTASAGTSTYAAKADHIHGTDLSRMAASGGNAFTATLQGTTTVTGVVNAVVSGTLTLTGTASVSALAVSGTATVGSLKLTGGTLTLSGALGIGSLSGAPIVESNLTLANNTTNNVSTSAHGFAPILPNDATKFLNGVGGYTVPVSSGQPIPGSSTYAVGTLIMAGNVGGSSIANNTPVAGSSLNAAMGSYNSFTAGCSTIIVYSFAPSTVALSGTWLNVSGGIIQVPNTPGNPFGYFVRIA
jgi:hypothetical protein